MIPGILPEDDKLVIHRNTAGSRVLQFIETIDGVDTPQDITGIAPFTAQVVDSNTREVLLEMTTETNGDDGTLAVSELRLSWTAAGTEFLPVQPAEWGLKDATNQPWIKDVCTIKPFP